MASKVDGNVKCVHETAKCAGTEPEGSRHLHVHTSRLLAQDELNQAVPVQLEAGSRVCSLSAGYERT